MKYKMNFNDFDTIVNNPGQLEQTFIDKEYLQRDIRMKIGKFPFSRLVHWTNFDAKLDLS